MATTASVGLILQSKEGENKAIIGNVGDSRVYLLRNNILEQVTLDDSPTYRRLEENLNRQLQTKLSNVVNPIDELTKQEQNSFYSRNEISQALGLTGTIPRISIVDLLNNDKLLVCSDGISDNLTDIEIQTILNSTSDADAAIQKLIEDSQARSRESHARAKPDDMTALIIEQATENLESPAAAEAEPVSSPEQAEFDLNNNSFTGTTDEEMNNNLHEVFRGLGGELGPPRQPRSRSRF
jgi:protein phosphatase